MPLETRAGWLLWLLLLGAVPAHGQSRALDVKLDATKQTFPAGEPLAVRVTLTNVGTSGVYLFRTLRPEGLLVRFTVLDEKGQEAYSSPLTIMERTSAFVQDTLLLDPGYCFGAIFKLSTDGRTNQPARYLPGRYRISAVYANHDDDGKGGTLTGTFRSNTVDVRVATAAAPR